MRPVVDTLHLTVETRVSDHWLEAEARCKSTKDAEHGSTVLERGSWRFRWGRLSGFSAYDMMAMGTGDFEGVNVLWGAPRGDGAGAAVRTVRVIIGSAPLWRAACRTEWAAYHAANETMLALVGECFEGRPVDAAVIPRRVDVCLDHWGKEWSIRDLERFACRQKGRGVAQSGEIEEEQHGDRHIYRCTGGTTFYLGRRGSAARFLRIYDKTVEAAATGKLPWMEPIWRQDGWDGKSKVWRAEIEHGSGWLKAHGMLSMTDLMGCERELWKRYLLDVRHTAGAASRLKRRGTSAAWRELAAAVMRSPSGLWQWRPRAPTKGADMQALLRQAAGCLAAVEAGTRGAFTSLDGHQLATLDDREAEVLSLVADVLRDRRLSQLHGYKPRSPDNHPPKGTPCPPPIQTPQTVQPQ